MFDARAKAMVLSVALLLAGTGFMVQPSSAASFNNVQIFANPISSQAHSFQFAAYNLSGSLIASYQGPYPAAAFELPSGGYLFTVSATDFAQPRMGYACPLAQGGASSSGTTSSSAPPTATGKVMPGGSMLPWCYPFSSEYGYAVTNIGGPQTVNIDLKNASQLPTTPVAVKVSYVNGTAVQGAYVYASVVGEWYYWWWGASASLNMSGQTDSQGIAHLIVPLAPTVITAWKWVPVFTDKNGTTYKVNVGGEEINVTAYWEPTYVGLSGSGLLLPPQNSLSITLHYQQPDYWVMPMGVASQRASAGAAPPATLASQPGGTPASISNSQSSQPYLPSQIPSVQGANPAPSGSLGSLFNVQTLGLASVVIVAVIAATLIAVRRRANRPSTTTR